MYKKSKPCHRRLARTGIPLHRREVSLPTNCWPTSHYQAHGEGNKVSQGQSVGLRRFILVFVPWRFVVRRGVHNSKYNRAQLSSFCRLHHKADAYQILRCNSMLFWRFHSWNYIDTIAWGKVKTMTSGIQDWSGMHPLPVLHIRSHVTNNYYYQGLPATVFGHHRITVTIITTRTTTAATAITTATTTTTINYYCHYPHHHHSYRAPTTLSLRSSMDPCHAGGRQDVVTTWNRVQHTRSTLD